MIASNPTPHWPPRGAAPGLIGPAVDSDDGVGTRNCGDAASDAAASSLAASWRLRWVR